MVNLNYIEAYLDETIQVKQSLSSDKALLSKIIGVSDLITERYKKGGKLLIAGNGGSAADAQHLAGEFVSRFLIDRNGLPAVALTTDSSIITAIGNDYGFEKIFSRQVQANGNDGDIFIGISTSGNSKNIIKAVHQAKKQNISTVALCGQGGKLALISDFVLDVPSNSTPHIQECHICIAHIICAIVEKNIFGK